MKISSTHRMEALQRIEDLLYGFNYAVWLEFYGPSDPALSLHDAARLLISRDAEIGGVSSATPDQVRDEILDNLLYPGDDGAGPRALEQKRAAIEALLEQALTAIDLPLATQASRFWLSKGHPACPVFWDFAFDVHANGKRWLIMGSSSD